MSANPATSPINGEITMKASVCFHFTPHTIAASPALATAAPA